MSPAFLLEIAVKSSVVLLLAWGLTLAMAKRSSAAARHVVWAAALAATLAMPAVVRFAPAWRLTHVSGDWMARAGTVLDVTWRGRAHRTDGEVWPAVPAPSNHAPFARDAGLLARASTPVDAVQSATPAWRTNGPVLLVRIWAIGAAIGITSLIAGLFWAAWLVRRAGPVTSPDWLASHAEALRVAEISATVRLLTSDRIGVPVVSGPLRPSLILPAESTSWDADRRRVVLLHELAHVARRDCLVQALAHLAWAIQWFNPLAFVAVTRLRAEQERASDDFVLTMGTRATDYAGHLCDIACTARRRPAPVMWATLAIARPSRLEARVRAILDDARSRCSPSRRFCAAIAAFGCLGVFSLGTLHLSGSAAQAVVALPSAALSAIAPYSPLVPGRSPALLALAASAAEPATAVAPLVARARPVAQELTADSGRAFLDTYCTTCHNSTRKTANLALDAFSPDRIGDSPDTWEKVARKIRVGLHIMPGVAPPSRSAADAFSTSVEAALDRADEANWASGSTEPLSDLDLAARIARFLWNSQPDKTLLDLAEAGKLHDHATLARQVTRMIADGRSSALLTGFFGDWLHLKNIAQVKPDPSVFPEFDDTLRAAFQRETELFIASQVREGHSLTDLLTAKYTFLNEALARHYGVPNVSGSQFRKVTLTDDTRAGLLGHGSVLAVTSFASRTSPVLRGKWLLQEWLGAPPPPPPANVPALKNVDPQIPASMRTRMEQHRKNPVCASCHVTMDSLGFALENFDALGRWRTRDGGEPIDASGILPDGTRFDGPAGLRSALLDRREAIVSTITLRLLAFALGRPARFSDMPAVRTIVWDAAPRNYTWSDTILGIVNSTPFRMKRLDF